MRHINYNHLLYFWTVATEGSVRAAAHKLNLTPQTISGQLKLLEDVVGETLFERSGRGLKITPAGKLLEQHADEIFKLGSELTHRIKAKGLGQSSMLNIGIVNSIPKLISYRILQPLITREDTLKLSCCESDLEHLITSLAVHKLDVILSDRPMPTNLNVKAFNHLLGSSKLAFFGQPDLIKRQSQQQTNAFPAILKQAPVLMPLHTNALRGSLEAWFDEHKLNPNIVAEFDDSALLKAFGQAGTGFFAAPSVIAEHIETMYGVRKIGEANTIRENYYLISSERHIKNPAVLEITHRAKHQLF